MDRILVTGGAGFIGSNFVHGAVREGHHVCNLDALSYAGNLANLADLPAPSRHNFVHGSINDRGLVSKLLADFRPLAVVNFAAESHVDRSIDDPSAFIRTNIDGTYEVLEAVQRYFEALGPGERSAFRFLHVSTDEVYGSIAEGQFHEDSPYAPNSIYAASKAAADHLVRAYNRTYGLPTLITNCGNNYGPRQFPEKLVPHMIVCALEGRPLPIYGDGQHVRDWLYVLDHCSALLLVLRSGRPGQSYNIGGNEERSNLSLVQDLCRTLDALRPRADGQTYAAQITFVADRPAHDRRYALDTGKVGRELGWAPEVDFAEGLQLTVRWFLDNEAWWAQIRTTTYGGERLGLAPRATAR